MKLIAERNPVDIALLPVGGHYTMDRHDGVLAAGLIGARTVIPMHFDTFPPIEADAGAFKSEVESNTSSEVVVLSPVSRTRFRVGRMGSKEATGIRSRTERADYRLPPTRP